ncbi:MAG: hypothetical protein FJ144_24145 [Deltaproteobacteria bacterium]|nr:hypothetical protein [Deltaproteobacteria bacterium]
MAAGFLTPQSQTSVTLSEGASGSQDVLVATDGDSFVVVWTAPSSEDDSAPLTEVRAIRVAEDGSATPPGGFLVDGDAAAKSLGAIAYTDGVYLVAWIEEGIVEAARLGTSGEDADVFTLDPGPASSVALATDGDRFLAVFDRAVDSSSSDVIGTFVSRE